MAIDVFGGLNAKVSILRGRRGSSSRRGGGKVTVEFTGDALVFDPQEREIARQLADSLAMIFREYMLSGRWLNGRPLPTVAGATVARRAYRVLQVTQGVAKGRQRGRLDRRFRTKKLGTKYPDAAMSGANLVGRESGTLANSIAVAPSGRGMQIFVADIRGKLDRSGSSPWLRVLAKMGAIGNLGTVLSDPRVQQAMTTAWRGCFVLNGRRLGSELAKTFAVLKDIAQEAEQLAESDGTTD